MTREEVEVEFAGYTHDHLMVNRHSNDDNTKIINNCNERQSTVKEDEADSLSTIAILRRHPMYDSLVLVKKYRACLRGYTLEFPTSQITHHETNNKQLDDKDCCKTKLVSLYLDGDDPIYQSQEKNDKNNPLSPEEEIVHVPMNGLLDRLDNYDRHGVSIDSRVYAFAMGLKTAEKFLRTSSVREVQETPPL